MGGNKLIVKVLAAPNAHWGPAASEPPRSLSEISVSDIRDLQNRAVPVLVVLGTEPTPSTRLKSASSQDGQETQLKL